MTSPSAQGLIDIYDNTAVTGFSRNGISNYYPLMMFAGEKNISLLDGNRENLKEACFNA